MCVGDGGLGGGGVIQHRVGNSLIVLAATIFVVGQNGVLLDMILNVDDGFKRRGRVDRPRCSKRLSG